MMQELLTGRTAISTAMDQKAIYGHLNQVIRRLLADPLRQNSCHLDRI